MIEKSLSAIPPQSFTQDGTVRGKIVIPTTHIKIELPGGGGCRTLACLPFKVKQKVVVTADGEPNLELEVKRVLEDEETLYVGPRKNNAAPGPHSQYRDGSINARTDLSAYTVAKSAAIRAEEQPRAKIPEQEIERNTYEHEPTVARRVFNVDEWGRPYSDCNPFPVDVAGITVPPLETEPLTHKDDDPNPGDIHDSVRIGDGVETADVTPCKDLRTVDTLHCVGGRQAVITVTDTPVPIRKLAANLSGRKVVTAVPLGKGVAWGFESNVDTTQGINGGTPLSKRQSLIVAAEDNVDVYLVGPAHGVKVAITEAG